MDIDYIVPMVFDHDEKWRSDYSACRNLRGTSMSNNVRFRSWGTEHLLVKCIKTFMPWVRTIHIILAKESQVQPWMRQEGVNCIFHREFIPMRYLPTFTSCTIEMFLPFIKDLSEYFIYGNDDIFPLSPLQEADFFINGLPCINLYEEKYPHEPNIFQRKCKRQQDMIGVYFGKTYSDILLRNGHSLAPMLKSVCAEVRNIFSREIESGITPNRSVTSYNQYIYVLWHYFTGKYIEHAPRQRYAGVKAGIEKTISIIREPDSGIVCVNDHESMTDISFFAKEVRMTIEDKLKL